MASKNSPSPKRPDKTPEKRQVLSFSPSPNSSHRLKSPKSLTDVKRRVRDCCASLHECIQKWESLNDIGINVATKLTNLNIQRQHSDVEDAAGLTVMSDLDKGSSSLLEDEIAKTTEDMSKTIEALRKVQTRMQSLLTNFQAIKELQDLKTSVSEDSSEVIAETWTASEFCNAAEKLTVIYCQELTLKEKIWPEYTQLHDRNMQLVLLSLWIHQPYLEDRYNTLLEGMLLEVGLR